MEACQSPVWDTALAVIGAGRRRPRPPTTPALSRAAEWLLERGDHAPGDWAVRRPGLQPGGWAFEFANDTYPDIDDTAEVVLALRRARTGRHGPDAVVAAGDALDARHAVVGRGVGGLRRGQHPNDLPNHPVLRLRRGHRPAVRRRDRPRRGDAGRAGAGRATTGPGAASSGYATPRSRRDRGSGGGAPTTCTAPEPPCPALIASGVPADDGQRSPGPCAGSSLTRTPTEAGARTCDPTSTRPGSARGDSTASQTAWALLALLAAGEGADGRSRGPGPVERGVSWLVRTQRADGSWDEPQFTGTGFPGAFYINYHLYRVVFPLQALGRFVNGTAAAGTDTR